MTDYLAELRKKLQKTPLTRTDKTDKFNLVSLVSSLQAQKNSFFLNGDSDNKNTNTGKSEKKCVIPELTKLTKFDSESKPDGASLNSILAGACTGIEIEPGKPFTVAMFKSLLSAEDIEDIEAGLIPVGTLVAHAGSFAKGIKDGRIEL